MMPLARARLQAALAALAIIVIVIAATVIVCGIVSGCADKQNLTPRNHIEVRSAVPVDYAALDTAWEQARDCWAAHLKRQIKTAPPAVKVIHEGLQNFGRPCAYFQHGGGWVAGVLGGREAWLPPDFCAARHEFSHWIERHETGSTEPIDTRCD